jgi:hypothetical protein
MISMTFPGLLLLLYFIGFFIEFINNAAIISLSMYDTKMEIDDFTTVDMIKIIFFTICWPAGLVIKAITALDHFAMVFGKLEEMDDADSVVPESRPEPSGAIVGDGDPVVMPRISGYETVRLPESLFEKHLGKK